MALLRNDALKRSNRKQIIMRDPRLLEEGAVLGSSEEKRRPAAGERRRVANCQRGCAVEVAGDYASLALAGQGSRIKLGRITTLVIKTKPWGRIQVGHYERESVRPAH